MYTSAKNDLEKTHFNKKKKVKEKKTTKETFWLLGKKLKD